MIEKFFKHSFIYFERFLSRFFEFCSQVLSNYLLEIHACMHAATPRLTPSNNATIFLEHVVFVDCCHSNTAIDIIFFCLFFVKIVEKRSVLILV